MPSTPCLGLATFATKCRIVRVGAAGCYIADLYTRFDMEDCVVPFVLSVLEDGREVKCAKLNEDGHAMVLLQGFFC